MAAARAFGRRPAGAQGWPSGKCCQVREARVEPGFAFRHHHRQTQGLTSRGGKGRPSSSGLQGANRIIVDVRGCVCHRDAALLLVGSKQAL